MVAKQNFHVHRQCTSGNKCWKQMPFPWSILVMFPKIVSCRKQKAGLSGPSGLNPKRHLLYLFDDSGFEWERKSNFYLASCWLALLWFLTSVSQLLWQARLHRKEWMLPSWVLGKLYSTRQQCCLCSLSQLLPRRCLRSHLSTQHLQVWGLEMHFKGKLFQNSLHGATWEWNLCNSRWWVCSRMSSRIRAQRDPKVSKPPPHPPSCHRT